MVATVFSSGAKMALGQTVTYELANVVQTVKINPARIAVAGRIQHRFPLPPTHLPLLLDERLGLPIALQTVLQTAALYDSLNWQKLIDRECEAADFLRGYLETLLPDALQLLLNYGVSLDLAGANLLVTVERGQPLGVQVRALRGVATITQIWGTFEIAPDEDELYRHFARNLIERNLLPLTRTLAETTGADYTTLCEAVIVALLDAIAKSGAARRVKRALRGALLILDFATGVLPDEIETTGSGVQTLAFVPFEEFDAFERGKCCKAYKKKKRCSDCPGLKKKKK
jgi:Ferric iron reductase FhuF-like transporter